jgi:hypothetical protein
MYNILSIGKAGVFVMPCLYHHHHDQRTMTHEGKTEIREFNLSSALSLGLLSSPNPSFSGIRKVMKFY